MQVVSLAVLFSGGTFLYASTVHVLPEVLLTGLGGAGMPRHAHHAANNKGAIWGPSGTQLRSICLLVAGALLPVVIGALLPEGD